MHLGLCGMLEPDLSSCHQHVDVLPMRLIPQYGQFIVPDIPVDGPVCIKRKGDKHNYLHLHVPSCSTPHASAVHAATPQDSAHPSPTRGASQRICVCTCCQALHLDRCIWAPDQL